MWVAPAHARSVDSDIDPDDYEDDEDEGDEEEEPEEDEDEEDDGPKWYVRRRCLVCMESQPGA